MFKDVSLLPETVNCIKIIDDKSLVVFTNEETAIYKQVGNKFYATETFSPNTPRDEDVCYTIQEVQTLPSSYDFITPIYHIMAILSAIAIFYFAYKLIIYPFFRKRI